MNDELVKCPWERIGRDDATFPRSYCIYDNRVVCFGKLSCDEYNEWLDDKMMEVKLDPDRSLPDCPYSYKGWTQYEESIYKQAQQDMLKRNWAKILKEKKDEG